MTHREGNKMKVHDEPDETSITGSMMLKAYAEAVTAYYESEKEFVADPTATTVWLYSVAADRLIALRDELRRMMRISDAVAALPPMIGPPAGLK